jgi:hypothetical protein
MALLEVPRSVRCAAAPGSYFKSDKTIKGRRGSPTSWRWATRMPIPTSMSFAASGSEDLGVLVESTARARGPRPAQ